MLRLLTIISAFLLICSSCKMEWSEEANTQFVQLCEKMYAKQYKAKDPGSFCTCLLGKVKEDAVSITSIAKIKKEKMDEMAKACIE